MTTPEEARKEADLIAGRYAMHATAKRLRDLASQVEALQADAERYRFLRKTAKYSPVIDGQDFVVFEKFPWPKSCHENTYDYADAAIDAARRAE